MYVCLFCMAAEKKMRSCIIITICLEFGVRLQPSEEDWPVLVQSFILFKNWSTSFFSQSNKMFFMKNRKMTFLWQMTISIHVFSVLPFFYSPTIQTFTLKNHIQYNTSTNRLKYGSNTGIMFSLSVERLLFHKLLDFKVGFDSTFCNLYISHPYIFLCFPTFPIWM